MVGGIVSEGINELVQMGGEEKVGRWLLAYRREAVGDSASE